MASRQTYYAESLSESTVTSATYQDKVSLTFTPDPNTDYILFWSTDVIEISTAVSVFSRLYNSTDAVVLSEQNQENRTTSGSPYRFSGGIAKFSAGASPVSTTFKIQYHDSDGASTAKIRNARLLAVRVDALDAYAESLSDQAVTSNTYVDGASLTFTPATTGDYLVFATCDFNHASTADEMYIRLLDPDGTTNYCELQHINRDTANYNPYVAMVKKNLTNSSKTFKLQIHRTSANTITIKNQRLYAMRLDAGFTNSYYAEDRTRATTTSTTFQDDNSLTQSTNAADHLIFNCAGLDGTLNSESQQCQFLEGATVIQGPFEARVNTSATYSYYYPQFVAYKATLTAASHTWKRQFKTITGSATAGINEDATSVLELSPSTIITSLAATEDNDSSSGSSQIKLSNTLAISEENDSGSSSAAVRINNSVNATEDDDSSAGTIKDILTTSLATTEQDDAIAGLSALKVQCTCNATEENDSSVISLAVKLSDSAAISEENDSAAITSKVLITTYLGRVKLPTDVSGLVAWYDAQDIATITKDASNNVSQWNDKSGNNNHVSTSTSTRKPKYLYSGINGLPSLQGKPDGTNTSFLTVTDNSSLACSELTIFVVAQRNTDTGARETFVNKYVTTAGQREWWVFVETNDSSAFTLSKDGTSIGLGGANAGAITTGSPLLILDSYNNTSKLMISSYTLGGTTFTSSTTYTGGSIFNGTGDMAIFGRDNGASPPLEGIVGYIGEVIIFNTDISAADKLALSEYLDQKWNLGFNPAYSVIEDDDTAVGSIKKVSTGSTGATEQDDSTSSAALIKLSASLAVNENDDTAIITNAIKINNSTNTTEQDDGLSGNATGVNSAHCTLAATEQDDSLTGASVVKITSILNATEENDNLSAALKIKDSASSSPQEENDNSAITGKLLIRTSSANTEAEDYSFIGGFVRIAANSNSLEGNDNCSIAANVKLAANTNISEEGDNSVIQAKVKINNLVNLYEEDDSEESQIQQFNDFRTPENTYHYPEQGRRYLIKVQGREYIITTQDRTAAIELEDRNYSVVIQNRLY